MSSLFPCSAVIPEWSWKKTQIEKKKKVHIGEEEVKHWQNVVYYFINGLLQTLSHIRTRLKQS